MSNIRRKDPPKPGRNAPCSCGSGAKYKKCCLLTEMKEQEAKLQRWKDGMAKRAEEARERREALLDNLGTYAPQPRTMNLIAACLALGIPGIPTHRRP